MGAKHYYGTVRKALFSMEEREHRLSYAMTAEQAAILSKHDKVPDYEEGDETTRFDSKAEVRQAAIEYFNSLDNPHNRNILVEWDDIHPWNKDCKVLAGAGEAIDWTLGSRDLYERVIRYCKGE